MELVQLQEKVHAEAAEPRGAAVTAAAAEAAGLQTAAAAAAAGSSREAVDTWGEWVARDETDHAVASSSSSGSRTGHEAWAHDASSAADAAGPTERLGTGADTWQTPPTAGADRAAADADTWGPDSGGGGTVPAATAAAAADAWGSNSAKVSSREGPAAGACEASEVRPSYSGVLKRGGSAAADALVARGAVWELAPAGEQPYDGW
uniref:Uncharacterized protein n=1 Tax=Tetradesmus obliquus TaxID=3088 RepID=A0A383WNF0_TETOB|eukprot:jgi/Sobl393_1/13812/SZX78931.1